MEYTIYRISHKTLEGLDYIGSTTDFERRKTNHKRCCLNPKDSHYNINVYQVIRANGGWDQFDMIAVKTLVCCNLEARQEEERIRVELNAKLNTIRAYISVEEYQEQFAKYYTEYRQQNKEQLAKYKEDYRQQNKEQIAKNLADYYQQNKDKLVKQQANYYQQNKEKILQKFDCECGGKYIHKTKTRHIKSKRHQDYLTNPLKK
jgi:hypothetical protein